MPTSPRQLLQRLGGLVLPLLVGGLLVLTLREPIVWWLRGPELFDEEAMREWIREARVESANLPELVKSYLEMVDRETQLKSEVDQAAADTQFAFHNELRAHQQRLEIKREEIAEFLKALGNPPTRLYRGQLPLFPLVYRLAIEFTPSRDLPVIAWDSRLPRDSNQYRTLAEPLHAGTVVTVLYHLHAYHQVQAKERQEATRRILLGCAAMVLSFTGGVWFLLFQRRQRQRESQRLIAEQQASQAERRRLEEALLRQEAERKHEEAERQNLELKSQLFANIGIMAGSYAHNIKNLLVRPNDLLRRCLDEPGVGQEQILREVKDTLGTVTERLQQILQTVRRDPNQSERVPVDLNALAREMQRTWADLSCEKWKLNLHLVAAVEADGKPTPLWVTGDLSHLQQAVENLLFNARDATFEMRNHLRDQARQDAHSEHEKRQALLDAAAWRGEVTIKTFRDSSNICLEVRDNGIGMSDEVRRQCTQTHFSTKRDNALFAGLNAGMGLGLSFVNVILAHHRATLSIESQPLQGTVFRIEIPAK